MENEQTTTIRQAEIQDLQKIVSWTISLHYHESNSTTQTNVDFEKNIATWIEREINNQNNLFLIASISNVDIGFIFSSIIINDNGFLKNPLSGVIHLLWIDEKHRNKHIAKQLLIETEACFMQLNITIIECTYTSCNEVAKKFWNNNGFTEKSITAQKNLTIS